MTPIYRIDAKEDGTWLIIGTDDGCASICLEYSTQLPIAQKAIRALRAFLEARTAGSEAAYDTHGHESTCPALQFDANLRPVIYPPACRCARRPGPTERLLLDAYGRRCYEAAQQMLLDRIKSLSRSFDDPIYGSGYERAIVDMLAQVGADK